MLGLCAVFFFKHQFTAENTHLHFHRNNVNAKCRFDNCWQLSRCLEGELWEPLKQGWKKKGSEETSSSLQWDKNDKQSGIKTLNLKVRAPVWIENIQKSEIVGEIPCFFLLPACRWCNYFFPVCIIIMQTVISA